MYILSKKLNDKTHACGKFDNNDKLKDIISRIELMKDIKKEYFLKYQEIKSKFFKYLETQEEKTKILTNILKKDNEKLENKISNQKILFYNK